MDLLSSVLKPVQFIYPPRCMLCHKTGHNGMDLCQQCLQTLPWNLQACSVCALPLTVTVSHGSVCGHCLQQRPAYDSAVSLFRYEPPVTTLIQRMKFSEKLAVVRLMTQLMADRLDMLQHTNCLVPVPLHKQRLRQRGFNQSIEIARPLARAMQVALETGVVRRVRNTPQQTGLDAVTRRKNIRGAFEVTQPLKYKTITLVDDVMTTGSTVNELARVLKKAGAQHVHVFSLARAV